MMFFVRQNGSGPRKITNSPVKERKYVDHSSFGIMWTGGPS